MLTKGRRSRHNIDIWPGFVDALAALLLVTMFVLMVFVLAQFFLGAALSGRDEALAKLDRQVTELAELLSLEQGKTETLRDTVAQLSTELQSSLAEREVLTGRLSAAESTRDQLSADLKAALSTGETLSERLAAMTRRAEAAETAAAKAREELTDAVRTVEADKEKIEVQLRELATLRQDIEILRSLRTELEAKLGGETKRAETAEAAVTQARDMGETQRRQIELLNRQLFALRQQIARLSVTLEASEAKAEEQKVQIANLGRRLNLALASKVAELARYRSEFFGRLREVLGERPDIRIVGDRFVFQSEVLFTSGSADLGGGGRQQLASLAKTLLEVTERIPADLDWVLRIDGHTDRLPIRTARFPSNWELSAARAISVAKYLRSRGVPPERLVAAGFSQYHPLDDRDDEISFRRN
ncbi:MAG: peptidoglycan -binding protein, partial [Alphaproteobacteria bacterium]